VANSAVLDFEPRLRATAGSRPRAPRELLLRLRTRLSRARLEGGIFRGVERPDDPALALREAQLVVPGERTRLALQRERILGGDAATEPLEGQG